MRFARRQLGLALQARVAGISAASAAQRIWGPPGPRWFQPSDPIWRVHSDAAMFPGGIASLLLQSLHPLAMAGVAGHSGYQGDPWGRLQRTSHYLATTTFGTVADAQDAIDRVRQVHEGVRGHDAHGRAYRASDPELLGWVHAAEILSFLQAYQVFGSRSLSPVDADRYVAQAAVPARRLGVLNPPVSVVGLQRQIEEYRGDLEATPAARDAARFLLLNPPLPLWARPGYGLLAAGGVSLLPPWAVRMLGFALPGPLPRMLNRGLGHGATAAVRWGMSGVR